MEQHNTGVLRRILSRHHEVEPLASIPNEKRRGIVVIGLGRFGGALALRLIEQGYEVLGVDQSAERVQAYSSHLSHVVQADGANERVLRQLGVHEFKTAVVGIRVNIEASILAASTLMYFGIPHVWARAESLEHGRVLTQLGVEHIVYPEHDMGERTAYLLHGHMLDYIQLDDGYALIKLPAPKIMNGQTLRQLALEDKYGVHVIGVKRTGSNVANVARETFIDVSDVLIVAGPTNAVLNFSDVVSEMA